MLPRSCHTNVCEANMLTAIRTRVTALTIFSNVSRARCVPKVRYGVCHGASPACERRHSSAPSQGPQDTDSAGFGRGVQHAGLLRREHGDHRVARGNLRCRVVPALRGQVRTLPRRGAQPRPAVGGLYGIRRGGRARRSATRPSPADFGAHRDLDGQPRVRRALPLGRPVPARRRSGHADLADAHAYITESSSRSA